MASSRGSPSSNRSPLGKKLRNAGLAELNGVTDEMRQKRREAQLELQRSLAAQIAAKQRRIANASGHHSPSRSESFSPRVENEDAFERRGSPTVPTTSGGFEGDGETNGGSIVSRESLPSSAPHATATEGLGCSDVDALTNLYLKLQHDHATLKEKFVAQQEHMISLIQEREEATACVEAAEAAYHPPRSSRAKLRGREAGGRNRLVRAGIAAASAKGAGSREKTVTTDPRNHPFWRRIMHFYEKHNPKMATQEKISSLMLRHATAAERANLLSALEKKYGFAVPPPRLGRRGERKRISPQERRKRAAASRVRQKKEMIRKKEDDKIRRRNENIANHMRSPRERGSVSRGASGAEDRRADRSGHSRGISTAESASAGAWRGRARASGGLETSSPLDAQSSFVPVPAWGQ
eukprot:g1498.t1